MKTYPLTAGALPELRVLGRTRYTPEGLPLFWTASGVELLIEAPALTLSYEADYEFFEPWVDILMNGVRTQRVMLQKGCHDLPIYRGGELASGEPSPLRHVRILRDTPAMPQDGKTSLLLRSLSFEGTLLSQPDPGLRLLFFGDSITSGEGCCGAVSNEQWESGCFDAVNTYAYLTAQKLGADFHVISQSGWGVYCDFLGNKACSIPGCEDRVCSLAKGEANERREALAPWDPSLFQPDAVVINLGTNDLSGIHVENGPGDAGYSLVTDAAYAFLKNLRSRYPGAHLLWCYGMLESDLPGGYRRMSGALAEAVDRFQREQKDAHVSYLQLPPTLSEDLGARSHPGPAAHEKTACLLAGELRRLCL